MQRGRLNWRCRQRCERVEPLLLLLLLLTLPHWLAQVC
jgi:hypothetical protein